MKMKQSNTLVFYYSCLSSSWNKKSTCFEEVERPKIIQVYANLCNILLSLYRIRQRTKFFYFHIVYCLLGMYVTNELLLYHRHQNQKSIPEKKSIINVGISNCYSKRAAICWEIGFSIRQSCGKPSFNTTVKEPLKKRRMPTVPESSNNTRFDKLDHFPVFQEKQQRCRKLRTGYRFIKCQKCRVALYLQKVRNCFTIYHTKR